ncbi:cadherin repeat domain-containing protein [Roseiconus nitratireducens]|uniref:Cadherin repeat domain-containing protein n=1 Tax=Roseiconus nitratireducens TaxID=2605748 RepID=A0A5M6DEN5_9BACT|nr:cadherin repeat domain-containing protein [Roseiconus nitratireducens]KAA5543655.1 cadherin repeat domain-containing protein [Roseiconus nitratireducens]
MNQRERILAILVGGLFVLGIGQWGFNKYRTAIDTRQNRLQSLEDQRMRLMEKQNQGALADRQMGEYLVRSVSSDTEQARSTYQRWLFDIVEKHNIRAAKVSADRITPVSDLYHQMSFQLTGVAQMPQIIALIHDVQAKDYLHRIRELNIKPIKSGEGLSVDLMIDVMSLNDAPVDAVEPTTDSWRVDPKSVAYSEPILNRNLFEPPNKAPSYSGDRTLQATVGRNEAFPLAFKDPEGQTVTYELVDAPDSVSLDPRSGTLRVQSDELKQFDVVVKAIDSGYPTRTVEQSLVVKIVEPPPKEEEPEVEPEFDDAKQTYLTGLVQGANDWTAWMNVRTRGKTLKLRVGDEFEIGSVRGVVREINSDHVKIDIGDRTVTLTSGGTLKSAVESGS